jgi:hypothetical protein
MPADTGIAANAASAVDRLFKELTVCRRLKGHLGAGGNEKMAGLTSQILEEIGCAASHRGECKTSSGEYGSLEAALCDDAEFERTANKLMEESSATFHPNEEKGDDISTVVGAVAMAILAGRILATTAITTNDHIVGMGGTTNSDAMYQAALELFVTFGGRSGGRGHISRHEQLKGDTIDHLQKLSKMAIENTDPESTMVTALNSAWATSNNLNTRTGHWHVRVCDVDDGMKFNITYNIKHTNKASIKNTSIFVRTINRRGQEVKKVAIVDLVPQVALEIKTGHDLAAAISSLTIAYENGSDDEKDEAKGDIAKMLNPMRSYSDTKYDGIGVKISWRDGLFRPTLNDATNEASIRVTPFRDMTAANLLKALNELTLRMHGDLYIGTDTTDILRHLDHVAKVVADERHKETENEIFNSTLELMLLNSSMLGGLGSHHQFAALLHHTYPDMNHPYFETFAADENVTMLGRTMSVRDTFARVGIISEIITHTSVEMAREIIGEDWILDYLEKNGIDSHSDIITELGAYSCILNTKFGDALNEGVYQRVDGFLYGKIKDKIWKIVTAAKSGHQMDALFEIGPIIRRAKEISAELSIEFINPLEQVFAGESRKFLECLMVATDMESMNKLVLDAAIGQIIHVNGDKLTINKETVELIQSYRMLSDFDDTLHKTEHRGDASKQPLSLGQHDGSAVMESIVKVVRILGSEHVAILTGNPAAHTYEDAPAIADGYKYFAIGAVMTSGAAFPVCDLITSMVKACLSSKSSMSADDSARFAGLVDSYCGKNGSEGQKHLHVSKELTAGTSTSWIKARLSIMVKGAIDAKNTDLADDLRRCLIKFSNCDSTLGILAAVTMTPIAAPDSTVDAEAQQIIKQGHTSVLVCGRVAVGKTTRLSGLMRTLRPLGWVSCPSDTDSYRDIIISAKRLSQLVRDAGIPVLFEQVGDAPNFGSPLHKIQVQTDATMEELYTRVKESKVLYNDIRVKSYRSGRMNWLIMDQYYKWPNLKKQRLVIERLEKQSLWSGQCVVDAKIIGNLCDRFRAVYDTTMENKNILHWNTCRGINIMSDVMTGAKSDEALIRHAVEVRRKSDGVVIYQGLFGDDGKHITLSGRGSGVVGHHLKNIENIENSIFLDYDVRIRKFDCSLSGTKMIMMKDGNPVTIDVDGDTATIRQCATRDKIIEWADRQTISWKKLLRPVCEYVSAIQKMKWSKTSDDEMAKMEAKILALPREGMLDAYRKKVHGDIVRMGILTSFLDPQSTEEKKEEPVAAEAKKVAAEAKKVKRLEEKKEAESLVLTPAQLAVVALYKKDVKNLGKCNIKEFAPKWSTAVIIMISKFTMIQIKAVMVKYFGISITRAGDWAHVIGKKPSTKFTQDELDGLLMYLVARAADTKTSHEKFGVFFKSTALEELVKKGRKNVGWALKIKENRVGEILDAAGV